MSNAHNRTTPMEHGEVHSSDAPEPLLDLSQPRRRQFGTGASAREAKGKGRSVIPSSMLPRMPGQARAGPSRPDPSLQLPKRKNEVDDDKPRRRARSSSSSSASIECLDEGGKAYSKADGRAKPPDKLDGRLGHRKSSAYLAFHATLAQDKSGPSTPTYHPASARGKNAPATDSPDPLDFLSSPPTPLTRVLNPRPSNEHDATPTKPKKRMPKALMARFIADDATPKAAKSKPSRKLQHSPSPPPIDRSKLKSLDQPPPPNTKGKGKLLKNGNGHSKKVETLPSSSPAEPPSSSPVQADGVAFFANMHAEEERKRLEDERKLEEQHQQLLARELAAVVEIANLSKVKKAKEFEFQADEWKDRDEEEFKAMRRTREQSINRSGADDFFRDAPKQAEAARRRRSLEARSRA